MRQHVCRTISQEQFIGCSCTEELPFADFGALETRYYLRLRVEDAPGVLAQTSRCLGDAGVSIRSMVQGAADVGSAELTFLTHAAQASRCLFPCEQSDVVESQQRDSDNKEFMRCRHGQIGLALPLW